MLEPENVPKWKGEFHIYKLQNNQLLGFKMLVLKGVLSRRFPHISTIPFGDFHPPDNNLESPKNQAHHQYSGTLHGGSRANQQKFQKISEAMSWTKLTSLQLRQLIELERMIDFTVLIGMGDIVHLQIVHVSYFTVWPSHLRFCDQFWAVHFAMLAFLLKPESAKCTEWSRITLETNINICFLELHFPIFQRSVKRVCHAFLMRQWPSVHQGFDGKLVCNMIWDLPKLHSLSMFRLFWRLPAASFYQCLGMGNPQKKNCGSMGLVYWPTNLPQTSSKCR